MKNIIYLFQIIVSILLIVFILIQQKRGGILVGTTYFQRRGLEKIIFLLTILLAILFTGLALFNLFLK